MIKPELSWEEIIVGKAKKKETSSEKRVEGMSLFDVEERFSVKSLEGLAGQDQPTKDQWSFTPLNVTDEAHEKCNVSEISNAASLLDSQDSMCSGENIPHELTEADLSGVVNPRTEYLPGPGDQYPVTESGKCYTGSSAEQADPEPVFCMTLFPLEEENLGLHKRLAQASRHFLLIFPQAGKKTGSDTTVISQIRDDHKIYEFVNLNQFYIDL